MYSNSSLEATIVTGFFQGYVLIGMLLWSYFVLYVAFLELDDLLSGSELY